MTVLGTCKLEGVDRGLEWLILVYLANLRDEVSLIVRGRLSVSVPDGPGRWCSDDVWAAFPAP